MEVLNNLIEQYSATNLYFAIFGLLLITSLGMFPGNTDIFMLMLGTLAATGVLSVEKIIFVSFTALLIGETVAFLLGDKVGKRALKHRFFQDEKYQKRLYKTEQYLSRGRLPTVLALRFVPILRPVNIAMVASLSHRPKSYYGLHVLLLAAYVPVNILIAKNFSSIVSSYIA